MSSVAPVLRDDGPPVRQRFHVLSSGHHHRLYTKRHSRFDGKTAAWYSEIRDLGRFVHLMADAVTGVVSHESVAGRNYDAFYRMTDVSERSSRLYRGDTVMEGFKRKIEQPLSLFAYFPYSIGACRVAEKALD